MLKIKYLPKENFFAYANDDTSYLQPKIEKKPHRAITTNKFIIGEQYDLKGISCDGFEMVANSYELVAVINDFNGIEMNSLVMKPISVPNNVSFFSLTRQDCNDLNIEYQDQLQLFSQNLNWEIKKKEMPRAIQAPKEEKTFVYDPTKPFNAYDLSTYPTDEKTETVMKLIVRMTGFHGNEQIITTPYNTTMPFFDFYKNLVVRFNGRLDPMPYVGAETKILPRRIITHIITKSKKPIIVSEDNSIFIEIDVFYKDMSTDNIIGIKPEYLHKKNISDLLVISWLEDDNKGNYYEISNAYRGIRWA